MSIHSAKSSMTHGLSNSWLTLARPLASRSAEKQAWSRLLRNSNNWVISDLRIISIFARSTTTCMQRAKPARVPAASESQARQLSNPDFLNRFNAGGKVLLPENPPSHRFDDQ